MISSCVAPSGGRLDLTTFAFLKTHLRRYIKRFRDFHLFSQNGLAWDLEGSRYGVWERFITSLAFRSFLCTFCLLDLWARVQSYTKNSWRSHLGSSLQNVIMQTFHFLAFFATASYWGVDSEKQASCTMFFFWIFVRLLINVGGVDMHKNGWGVYKGWIAFCF